MMKFLYPEVPWTTIKAIGFDIDGTLYDEFDFIVQVYKSISPLIAGEKADNLATYQFMLNRWIEKGSSYPFIFSETLERNNIPISKHESIINEVLIVFRNFCPILKLSERILFMLEHCRSKYELFIVSDGSSELQWNKFNALGLDRFFKREAVFISGDHGKNTSKPGIHSLKMLPLLLNCPDPNQVVYIGDRQVDALYARNAHFYFINVKPIFVNTHL